MAHPSYNRIDSFDPLGDPGASRTMSGTLFQSPETYSNTWGQYHGELGASPEVEMMERARPSAPMHRDTGNSEYSTTGTLFPSRASPINEDQSYLLDPANKIDHVFTTNSFVPYKDNTARQFRHILLKSSFRFLITVLLCAGLVAAVKIWQTRQSAQSETQKKIFNAVTTAISLGLSLNIASAFKDMALNMRWPILSSKERSLEEVDHILHADSMTALAVLLFKSPRPRLILICAAWLFINLLAQAAIAMISLTYNWDTAVTSVLLSKNPGDVSITNMDYFYPSYDYAVRNVPSEQDQEYTAHVYGSLAYDLGISNITEKPNAGEIYNSSLGNLYVDYAQNMLEYIFLDSPNGTYGWNTYSIYTSRTINTTYICESHKVTENGDGNSNNITVADVGVVDVWGCIPNATSFFTNPRDTDDWNTCDESGRCTIVEVFEASNTDPWYYKCNITVGATQADPKNVSFVSDNMARIAGSSIAQVGYALYDSQEVQIYPRDTAWGGIMGGDVTAMGMNVATFALSSIGGAGIYNPMKTYQARVPGQGQALDLGHQYFFYILIGSIMLCHFIFVVVVARFTNRVLVGPEGHLEMSLLLRSIADSLEGVSGGKKDKAYHEAVKKTFAKYEKSPAGRWVLKIR